MSRVKVTEIRGAFAFEGASYGPFQANGATPFVEVPAALASVLNLPLHESEVAAQAEQADAGASADVEQLLKANHDLKADLDKATGERDDLRNLLGKAQARIDELTGKVFKLVGERDGLQARIAELEAPRRVEPAAEGESPAPDSAATPLPDALPLRELLIENHFDTFQKLEAGLVVAEGQTESPVQQIDGIGKKTVQVYEKAVADWKAGKQ